MKFRHNLQFLTFVIFSPKILNIFENYKKIEETFLADNLQFFVFPAVFKIFGFDNGNFQQRSCDILARYCTVE